MHTRLKRTTRAKSAAIVLALTSASCVGPTTATSEDLGGRADAPAPLAQTPCDWPQPFGTSSHAGRACPELRHMQVMQQIVQDPDADEEVAQDGFLQIHLPPVVTTGDWVVVPTKSGFTSVFDRTTEQYHVTGWRWTADRDDGRGDGPRHLVQIWSFDSTWQPIDAVVDPFFVTNGYVQGFSVVISGGSVFVPEAHGQMTRLSLTTGVVQQRISPFGGTVLDGDDRLTVTNYPSVSQDGAVYYGATAWPTGPSVPVGATPRGAYLVKVRLDGSTSAVDWSPDNTIKIGGGPVADGSIGVATLSDLCEYRFGTSGTPLPTGPDSTPPRFRCGMQRPAMNAPFAFTPTGNPVVFSYANNARAAGYLIEVDRETLRPIRSASLRDGHLHYGCGVRLTDFDAFPNCVALTSGGTTNLGVDPDFNADIHLRTPADIMDNAPVVSPDGDEWVIGSYDGGFTFEGEGGYDARGSLIVFRQDGTFRSNNPRYGWEVTPSAFPTSPGGFGFRWLQDENLFSLFDLKIATNDADMNPISSGGPADPGLFEEFVDTHVTFGAAGDHYGVAASGHFFKLGPDGQILESLPLHKLDGSLANDDTESVYVARDRSGHAYVPAGGIIHVVESSGTPPGVASETAVEQDVAPTTRKTARDSAKFRAASRVQDPGPPVD